MRRSLGVLTALLPRLVVVAVMATGLQAVSVSVAQADPAKTTWAKLRMCESSDRYDVNTSTGYYGAYQFDLPTWKSVGGSGYPHQASPREQDFRALYLYRMRGWQPWECGNENFLNLRDDRHARSKRVPTYAESAYIGGKGRPATAPSGMPAWPGLVFEFGDCSDHLSVFQLRLNKLKLGHTFSGTGCYLGETKKAVVALQKANGIKASGLLGPKTWRAAWKGNAPGARSKPKASASMPKWPGLVYDYGSCADAVKTFQKRMNKFGYDFQGSGCYYAETKKAVVALQKANGIKASGLLGPKTWKAAWQGKAPR